MHGDHFLGVLNILFQRTQLMQHKPDLRPLLVLGPERLKIILDEYNESCAPISYYFVDCEETLFKIKVVKPQQETQEQEGKEKKKKRKKERKRKRRERKRKKVEKMDVLMEPAVSRVGRNWADSKDSMRGSYLL